MAFSTSLLSEYTQVAICNLRTMSRTAIDGSIDVSSATTTIPESCKGIFSLNSLPPLCAEEFSKFNLSRLQIRDLQKANEKVAILDVLALINMPRTTIREKVIDNFITSIEYAYNRSLSMPLFNHYTEVKMFISNIAIQLGNGIVLSEKWFRCHDSDMFPVYTLSKNLHEAFEDFCQQFFVKLNALHKINNPTSRYKSAVDISAWVEYRINLTDHFIADGCGKTAAIITTFVYMVAGARPEDMPLITRSRYFNKNILPKTRRGTNPIGEKIEFNNWQSYYCTEFFSRQTFSIHELGLFTRKKQILLSNCEPSNNSPQDQFSCM